MVLEPKLTVAHMDTGSHRHLLTQTVAHTGTCSQGHLVPWCKHWGGLELEGNALFFENFSVHTHFSYR